MSTTPDNPRPRGTEARLSAEVAAVRDTHSSAWRAIELNARQAERVDRLRKTRLAMFAETPDQIVARLRAVDNLDHQIATLKETR